MLRRALAPAGVPLCNGSNFDLYGSNNADCERYVATRHVLWQSMAAMVVSGVSDRAEHRRRAYGDPSPTGWVPPRARLIPHGERAGGRTTGGRHTEDRGRPRVAPSLP